MAGMTDIASLHAALKDAKSVGKYFLPKTAGGCESGWMAVCGSCADTFGRYHKIEYFELRGEAPGNECAHQWEKKSLVTQTGGYDVMICRKCGTETQRFGLGQSFHANT
ncbi:hypothetical protein [Herbaspirillum huttiense]|uniref:hypothetical protein n=1 Tax=Herbaspirillum huttiense TaxID=863372 RepID=UPI0039B011D7